jgi:DNA-binding transcriptional LysR family regulator
MADLLEIMPGSAKSGIAFFVLWILATLMAKLDDWVSRIGRRVRLRDLHVLFAVVQCGSMAKAARQLGITQSAVSQVIADLECALDVRLLDRTTRGVEATIYCDTLLKRSKAAFDELKQGVQEIQFLADPTKGEVRIVCPETVAAILPPVIQSLSHKHPDLVIHVSDLAMASVGELSEVRDRSCDLALVRIAGSPNRYPFADDLNVEVLFNDETLIVAGANSRWAGRRKIEVAELSNARWILPTMNTLNNLAQMQALRALGIEAPRIRLVTFSVQLRAHLLTTGDYITVFPRSMMRLFAGRMALKILPIKLPVREWPVVMVTLKNRTQNPAVQLFMKHLREDAVSLDTKLPKRFAIDQAT